MSIRDVGPTRDTFAFTPQHSAIGRITALAAAGDGSRVYAGSFAGVWRSDDGGQNWQQMTWTAPDGIITAEIPGALFAPDIYDVVISPADASVVLVSALNSQFVDGRDGIYRSTDAGATWTLVLKNLYPCNITFAPDDASLVFAATGYDGVSMSKDGGVTWKTVSTIRSWHVAVGPSEPGGVRRVYAVGDSEISYSSEGGATWTKDVGVVTINASRAALNALRLSCIPGDTGIGGFGGSTDINFAQGAGAKTLAIEPGNPTRVYMATEGAANGPSYYDTNAVPDGTLVNTTCARFAGEASVWLGDFSQFSSANPMAQWTSLPGPPVYYGVSSPSGVTFVVTKQTNSGFLLFFADCSHVHVSDGTPTATTSWHRLDGEDVSVANQAGHHSNVLWVHADPHGIAFTSDFEIVITPATGVNAPYNQNSVLSQYIGGTLWMANDGGANWCSDGGQNANSWNWPLGLNTLDPVNIAGLFGIGGAPALYFGCGDNDDFFSRDGGTSWGDPGDNCGDCDAWFTDIATSDRVIQFLPRAGVIGIVVSSDPSQYPDASDSASKTFVPTTQIISAGPPPKLVPYASSGWVLQGYRPIVKTLTTEAALPDGDYIFVNQDLNTGIATLLRTTAIRSISQASDWLDAAKASPVGPALPRNAFVIQTSGGHQATAFYIGDGNNATGSVWKLDATAITWNQIVPSGPAPVQVNMALSWFVNPYDPDEIYVLDPVGVKVSADGGQSWLFHATMTNAVTANGKLSISSSLLQDMQFSRGEYQTRFAVGRAGVACSMDFGVTWFQVLNSIAIPGIPESGFFDPISNQDDRAFYVECQGRNVLRIGDLPALSSFQPPPVFDLMEFAALDY